MIKMRRPTGRLFNHVALGGAALGVAVALLLGTARLQGEPGLGERLAHRAGVPRPALIAHRGASYRAPESTRPAYLLARELGVDYLEVDVQRSRDHVLVALHDRTLGRVTDVAEVFPERAASPVEAFTFAELQRLDAGSWFNEAFPERARASFRGLSILRLEDVLEIAEGGAAGPGVYLELKRPQSFPGVEARVLRVLTDRGWIGPGPRADAGHGRGSVILQSFDRASLATLKTLAPGVPRILLLSETTVGSAPWESVLEGAAEVAIGIGPWGGRHEQGPHGSHDASITRYRLTWPWRIGDAHRAGLLVHPWTIDEAWDMWMLRLSGADGLFTNRPVRAREVFGRAGGFSVESVWSEIGY